MRSERTERERLQDILGCTQRIIEFLKHADSLEVFSKDLMLQDAVLYELTIIGEAVHHLPPALIAKYPETDWAAIDAMRNFVVHAYHRVDLSVIWTTAQQEVPELNKVVERALQENC